MRLAAFGVAVIVTAWSGAASGQQNLDAGKTPPQLFNSHCSACHKNAAGLARGQDASSLASFLRQHYTTGRDSAAALGAYVASIPEPRQAARQPSAPASAPPGTYMDPRLPNGTQQPGAATRRSATAPAERTPRPRHRAPGEPATVEGDPPPLTVRAEAHPVEQTEADRAKAHMVLDSPALAARSAEAARQPEPASHRQVDVAPAAPPVGENSGAQPTFSDPVP